MSFKKLHSSPFCAAIIADYQRMVLFLVADGDTSSHKIASVLSKPAESAIITIIRKLAMYSQAKKDENASSVEKARDTLNILKQAKVVDGAAWGL